MEWLLLLHWEGLVQVVQHQSLPVLDTFRLTGHVSVLRVVSRQVGNFRGPAQQQSEGLVESLVLDQHVNAEHDRSHNHESKEQLASVVVVESIGGLADSELIADAIGEVSRSNDDQPATQTVVGEEPGADHTQNVIPDLQIRDLTLVHLESGHSQGGYRAGEHIQADEYHIRVGRDAETLAHSVHRRGHSRPVQNEEHQSGRGAAQSKCLHREDLKQACTYESGNQEIHHVPNIGGKPIGNRSHASHQLQMLALCDPLVHHVHSERSWDERHGKDQHNGHSNVCHQQLSTGRVVQGQLLAARQRVVGNFNSGQIRGDHLSPHVCPRVQRNWHSVKCPVLEPYGHISILGNRQSGERRVHQFLQLAQEVPAHIEVGVRHWQHPVGAQATGLEGRLEFYSILLPSSPERNVLTVLRMACMHGAGQVQWRGVIVDHTEPDSGNSEGHGHQDGGQHDLRHPGPLVSPQGVPLLDHLCAEAVHRAPASGHQRNRARSQDRRLRIISESGGDNGLGIWLRRRRTGSRISARHHRVIRGNLLVAPNIVDGAHGVVRAGVLRRARLTWRGAAAPL
mmetsp:Transcript_58339/g.127913  ORF Transcript_58339/g.127913 Transcript_58339/m.127913 type:complete len:567 (-) Transcript_58339:1905-3605(-)